MLCCMLEWWLLSWFPTVLDFESKQSCIKKGIWSEALSDHNGNRKRTFLSYNHYYQPAQVKAITSTRQLLPPLVFSHPLLINLRTHQHARFLIFPYPMITNANFPVNSNTARVNSRVIPISAWVMRRSAKCRATTVLLIGWSSISSIYSY